LAVTAPRPVPSSTWPWRCRGDGRPSLSPGPCVIARVVLSPHARRTAVLPVLSGSADEGRLPDRERVVGTRAPGRPEGAGPTAGGPAGGAAPPGRTPARGAGRGARGRLRRDPADLPGGVPQLPPVRRPGRAGTRRLAPEHPGPQGCRRHP